MFDPASGLCGANLPENESLANLRRFGRRSVRPHAKQTPVMVEFFLYFHVFLRRILAFFVYFVLRARIRVRSCIVLTLNPVKGFGATRP